MAGKPTYEDLEQRIRDLEEELAKQCSAEDLPQKRNKNAGFASNPQIEVSDITIQWDIKNGECTFENLPVAMMWVDTTLASLMSGVQSMIGKDRFALALQAEGRKSVEADWQVISQFSDFQEGFKAIANIAAVAGWGEWRLISLDNKKKKCHFRIKNSWEGKYQNALGICWGSGMLAGKLAGYVSRLFSTNCWAEQTTFVAKGDPFDEFMVRPSDRTIEKEIEDLLLSDEATKADMAVALQKLQKEISERERAEEEQRELQAQLSNALEMAHLGPWEYDIPNNTFTFNDYFYKIFRTTAGQVGGYTMLADEYAERFVHPDDTPLVGEEIRKAIETDDPNYSRQLEHRILYADGTVGYITVRFFIVKDADGRTVKTYGVNQDITERKKAEEERKRLEVQLQQAQKMESIGTLAGGIAHDFNNILGIIVGNTEIAMMDIPKRDSVHHNLAEIHKACIRARDMVKQILAFSRQSQQEMKPLRISPIIKEFLKLLRSSIPTTIEIRQRISNESDTVNADPTQIRQVLLNLCTNAEHAMREKGGVLEVSLEDAELDKKAVNHYHDLTPGNYVKLSVSDTGCGIDPEIIDRIFDPYYTTKEVSENTGMGLAVVHGIVKNHGGFISVESDPGKGSTFQVYLPRIEFEVKEEIETTGELIKGNERILFVDDEKAIVDAARPILERLGYKVETRTGSVEALEAFRAKPDEYDLIITDMTMPNMTGVELMKKVRQIRPDIPVILCTGYSEMIDSNKAKDLGINAFAMKPLVMRKISGTIRDVLNKK